jgi:hypothetical protein
MRGLPDLLNTKFTLIASLPANDYRLAEAAWENGADAVKVHINTEHRASGARFLSFDEEWDDLRKILDNAKGPVGIVAGSDPETVGRDGPKAAEAGFNFISVYAHHAPPCLSDVGAVKMLAADYSYTADEYLYFARYADVFEASVITPDLYGARLHSRDLMIYASLCGAASLPVVVPTQKHIMPSEVIYLRDAGVSAIMIGAIVAGKTAGSFGRATAAFRQAIDALP